MSDHQFNIPSELDEALANVITRRLRDAITERGSATLVVSGGSTPKGLFKQLSQAPLPWSEVTILLADERWVSAKHEDSNERMVKSALLQHCAADARFLSLIPAYPDEIRNLAVVSEQLAGIDTFDVVILGMGGDMHTASLFPCSDEIAAGLNTSASVLMTHPKSAPHARISLSRQRLENTRAGIIHIVGKDKWQTLINARGIIEKNPDSSSAPIGVFAEPEGRFEVWHAPKA